MISLTENVNDLPLFHQTEFKVRAICVGSHLTLRKMEETESLALNPLTIKAQEGIAVLYRYGVVVLFGVTQSYETELRERLIPLAGETYSKSRETEEIGVRIDDGGREGVKADTIFLKEMSLERIQLIADVLAKSVVLSEYEAKIAQEFDQIEPMAINMERHGRITCSTQELLRDIGAMLLSEHVMVGRVNIPEKPDVLWDNPELQGLYSRLEDEFEIIDRHAALERKLQLISRTAETLLELVNNRHSQRLEWGVLILIGMEVVVTLYGILFGK